MDEVIIIMSVPNRGISWVFRWVSRVTEPFLDADGHPHPGSISQKVSLPINGVQLGMVIRGKNRSNPVLLWVHGNPGMPDYPLTQQYPTDLEDLFTVVWWDQRGAALSYDRGIPPKTMTIGQFIDDTLAVADHLRERFQQDRIYLLGHSWGSLLAQQAAARSPHQFKAYLGMAGMPDAYLRVRDSAMHRLGIGTTHDMRSVITGIFLASWRFPGYSLREKVSSWRGPAFSRRFGLWEQFIRTDLLLEEPRRAHRILQRDVLAGATTLADQR